MCLIDHEFIQLKPIFLRYCCCCIGLISYLYYMGQQYQQLVYVNHQQPHLVLPTCLASLLHSKNLTNQDPTSSLNLAAITLWSETNDSHAQGHLLSILSQVQMMLTASLAYFKPRYWAWPLRMPGINVA